MGITPGTPTTYTDFLGVDWSWGPGLWTVHPGDAGSWPGP